MLIGKFASIHLRDNLFVDFNKLANEEVVAQSKPNVINLHAFIQSDGIGQKEDSSYCARRGRYVYVFTTGRAPDCMKLGFSEHSRPFPNPPAVLDKPTVFLHLPSDVLETFILFRPGGDLYLKVYCLPVGNELPA